MFFFLFGDMGIKGKLNFFFVKLHYAKVIKTTNIKALNLKT